MVRTKIIFKPDSLSSFLTFSMFHKIGFLYHAPLNTYFHLSSFNEKDYQKIMNDGRKEKCASNINKIYRFV